MTFLSLWKSYSKKKDEESKVGYDLVFNFRARACSKGVDGFEDALRIGLLSLGYKCLNTGLSEHRIPDTPKIRLCIIRFPY